MKRLLDANLSPAIVGELRQAGYVSMHVSEIGLLTANDPTIFDRAAADGWTLVTADSDFATMLAVRRSTSPSVVLLRHVAELTRDVHAALLLSNLPSVIDDLESGAIVSLSPTRMAVRTLPIR